MPKRSNGTLARMRKSVFIFAALSASTLASGCATAAVGAVAGVGVFAVQDRTIGEGIDDATASQEVKTRLMAADSAGFAQVDVEVANGSLLLSGAAPTEEHKQAAEMIARNPKVDPHKRAEKAEILQWFTIWLETPDAFFDWLEVRKRAPEFVEKFAGAE